jgi:AraC-like DNA-binding protein
MERIPSEMIYSEDPLRLRLIVNDLTLGHFLIYLLFAFRDLIRTVKKQSQNFWKLENVRLRWLRNFLLHFVAIIVIFVFVKLYFGRDLGDYFIASYIALLLYLTSFKVVNDSLFFKNNQVNPSKYKKSSLGEEQKRSLLNQLMICMVDEKYYLNNMASLPDLAKKVGAGSHHVSQVINERLEKSFFEWLAENRIEAAKKALSYPETASITIEELAERVGYNSRSAFSKAFKKYTGKTPGQYRDEVY